MPGSFRNIVKMLGKVSVRLKMGKCTIGETLGSLSVKKCDKLYI